MSKNTVNIYGCGGAGFNIAQSYLTNPVYPEEGVANIDAFMIDTSQSNIVEDSRVTSHFMLVGSQSGSGGVRAENSAAAEKTAKDILVKFKPAEMNIIVSSASGGSGNILLAYLHRELLLAGRNVVSILITDDNSLMAIKNSRNTLLTLNNFARQLKKPFVTMLFDNSDRSKTDMNIDTTIKHIATLFSNEHHELDNTDTRNFLDFSRVTNVPAGLVAMNITALLPPDDDSDLSDTIVSVTSQLESINPNVFALSVLYSNAAIQSVVRGYFSTAYSCEGFIKDRSVFNPAYIYTIDFNDVQNTNDKLSKAESALQSKLTEMNSLHEQTLNEFEEGDGLVL